ncbi:hypothetical protein [Archangium lansingense]|uniref:Collagen triple helix repeat protein n=1 Tax=Archangium lansingense TaxID=2995310 RepID=A0ABT4A081_9BACT|nr:hypothetical protein [Archangium lansinium]MCY1074377.1 hypothetical protein [Archangium lansinium]
MACTAGPKGEPGPAGPDGPAGTAGPQGPTGPQGPSATSRPAVWRDANNTYVGPVLTNEEVLYFDAGGRVWFVDPSTGQLQAESLDIKYDAADCTGNAYVNATLPRLVFQVPGDSADTLRTQSDTYTATNLQLKSTRTGTSCFNTGHEQAVVPLADTLPTTPIVKPAVTFVGPLHLALQ